jgi:hypothetical protein
MLFEPLLLFFSFSFFLSSGHEFIEFDVSTGF